MSLSKTTIPISVLCAPMFALYVAVAFDVALQLSGLLALSLSLGVSITFPSIVGSLALLASLAVMWQNVLSFPIPSVTANLGIMISAQLGIVAALILALKALVAATVGASLDVLAYVGAASGLGGAVSGALVSGWPDGTSASQSMTAVVLVATSTGAAAAGSVESVTLLQPPPRPPQPATVPAIPSSLLPPPQMYTAGLAAVTFSPAPSGGRTATGTCTVTQSANTPTGIGTISAVTVVDGGEGYATPPTVSLTDSAPLVSLSATTPIVATLPAPLSVAVGTGVSLTFPGVTGSTAVLGATAATPIVLQVASAAGLTSCTISGATGLQGLNGSWYCQPLDATHVALYSDPAFSLPSTGTGSYAGGGVLVGNLVGPFSCKVLTPTTVALYLDGAFTQPAPSYGTYAGGSAQGAGTGAVASVVMGGGSVAGLPALASGVSFPVSGLAASSTTIGACFGASFQCLADLLVQLEKQAAALTVKFTAQVVPSFPPLMLLFMAKILLNLKAALSAGFKAPSISATASAQAGIAAQVAVLGKLSGEIGALLGLGTGEVDVYVYTGPGAGLGPALSVVTGPACAALVLGATSSASATALGVFLPVAA